MRGDVPAHAKTTAKTAEPAGDVTPFLDRVRGTNISETTLLATDYLNHFNEIVMLIEMVPEMPEMLDEAREWRPKSYVAHFAGSASPLHTLAIELYPHVPAKYRVPFETTIGQLEGVIDRTLRNAENALAKNDMRALRDRIGVALDPMRRLVDIAAGIIHGAHKALSQDEIDSLIGT